MSARQTNAQPRRAALLTELALRQLLDEHETDLSSVDRAWLPLLWAQAKQGILPRLDQVSRISKIRAEIAKRRSHIIRHATDACSDGAA
ncbi:MAG TPA: hypothetical protein VNF04_01400 [Stellaceae bacterium]|nr:hypothetical protein [Stellaceae bacterium]